MSKSRIYVNRCVGGVFRFDGDASDFHSCFDCEWWGYLDEAPDSIREAYEREYADEGR